MAKLHLDFIWLGADTWWCSGIMHLRSFLPVLISVAVFFWISREAVSVSLWVMLAGMGQKVPMITQQGSLINVSVFFVWAELPHSGAWYSVGA